MDIDQFRQRFLARTRRLGPATLIFLVAAFAGTFAINLSQAAIFVAKSEAESGSVAGNASPGDPSGASAGASVKFGSPVSMPPSNATMTAVVDGGKKYQTIDGLGAAINVHSWDNGNLKPALDKLVDGNGTKVFRVVYDMTDWETTNDNSDPNSYNWTYYEGVYSSTKINDIWNTIDYLHQKGVQDNQIVLAFMGIGPPWMGKLGPASGSEAYTLTSGMEAEWAEMTASLAYYGYNHGHTFGVLAPTNELDWSYHEGIVMSTSQWAKAMNLLDQKLTALGGMDDVRFSGPESVGSNPSNYVSAVAGSYPALMNRFDVFTGHNYGNANTNGPTMAAGYGKKFWTSEFSDFDYAIPHLLANSNSLVMWDAYDSVYEHAKLNGLGSAPGNDKGPAPAWLAYSPTTKAYTPRQSFYQFGQLSKYTQAGTQRVDISSSKSGMQLIAFIHPTSGSVTIVGQNNTGAAQVVGGTLKNIPTNVPTVGNFHYSQTTATDNMKAGADVIVTNGTFSAPVAKDAVFTLTTLPL